MLYHAAKLRKFFFSAGIGTCFLAENALFLKKNAKKFGHVKKKQYFCTRF
jgi:hypothetical protein